MSQPSTPSQEYLRNTVLTATPEQLHLMLFDGAIRFATRGLEALRTKDRESMFNALERAQLIVLEMRSGIQREVNPDLADRMSALYNFVYRRLVDANIGPDEEAAEQALRILRHQRETWLLLIDRLQKSVASEQAATGVASAATSEEGAPAFTAEG